MNITLREVYQTSADADRFWKLKECYIRGSTVRTIPHIFACPSAFLVLHNSVLQGLKVVLLLALYADASPLPDR